MKPAPFDYYQPRSLDEALELLSRFEGAKVLAGGQSLMAMMNMRFVQPEQVIDVNRIDLDYIRLEDSYIAIGAGTRQRDIQLSAVVREHAPLMIEALQHVGHVQTRNRGTIGGSLCHLDPAAELPSVCMTLGAEVVAESKANGRRVMPMVEFAADYMTPAIGMDELVTEIRVPLWPESHGYAFEEFARRHGDFAIASASVAVTIEDDVIDRIAISIGGLASVPTRITEAESFLSGKPRKELKIEHAATLCGNLDAISDSHATSEHRQHLATVLASRALNRAVNRAVREVSK